MTDVLERLSADNPVPVGSPPPFEEVWQRLERESTGARPRRQNMRQMRAAALTSIALVPVVVVAVVAITTLGHRSSSAGGGASPSGAVLVQYRLRSVSTPGPGSGANHQSMVTVANVWVSGSSVHQVENDYVVSARGGAKPGQLFHELATDGRTLRTFQTGPMIGRGMLVVRPASTHSHLCLLLMFCESGVSLDPVAGLKELYKRGELVLAASDVLLHGRRVDKLKGRNAGLIITVFVDPGTFIPIMLTVERGPRGTYAPSEITTIIGYQRLPLTVANQKLLQMDRHPGAPVFCANADGGGLVRVTGAAGCFFGRGRSLVASGRRRSLPETLVRSFRVFRGLKANEAKAIPNNAGLDVWLVPQTKQTCIMSMSPRARFPARDGDCVPNSMALAGEMSPILGGSNGVTVIGLAPNGNRAVKLVLANGSSATVPVSHNVYIARAPHGFKTVTLKDSTGSLRTWNVPDGAPR
jgi:hypothetical protein